jgi:hypothetical protein
MTLFPAHVLMISICARRAGVLPSLPRQLPYATAPRKPKAGNKKGTGVKAAGVRKVTRRPVELSAETLTCEADLTRAMQSLRYGADPTRDPTPLLEFGRALQNFADPVCTASELAADPGCTASKVPADLAAGDVVPRFRLRPRLLSCTCTPAASSAATDNASTGEVTPMCACASSRFFTLRVNVAVVIVYDYEQGCV